MTSTEWPTLRHSVLSRACTLTLALALVGCASEGQKPPRQTENRLKYAIGQNERCQKWLRAHDVFQRLEDIFILNPDDIHAADKVLIQRTATDGEKQDLLRSHNLQAVCRKDNLENFGDLHPDFAALLAKWYAEDDRLLLELLNDRVAVGEANAITRKRMAQRPTQAAGAEPKITQQLEAREPTDMADRQSAITAMQQWHHQQQLLLKHYRTTQSTVRPTIIICDYTADGIACTKY